MNCSSQAKFTNFFTMPFFFCTNSQALQIATIIIRSEPSSYWFFPQHFHYSLHCYNFLSRSAVFLLFSTWSHHFYDVLHFNIILYILINFYCALQLSFISIFIFSLFLSSIYFSLRAPLPISWRAHPDIFNSFPARKLSPLFRCFYF